MQLEYLAKALGMQAVAGSTIVRHEGEYGNALLTRRRILDVKRHDLSFRRFEPRGALEVDIEVEGSSRQRFRDASRAAPFGAALPGAKSAGSAAQDSHG